jgi:hypothetical protein
MLRCCVVLNRPGLNSPKKSTAGAAWSCGVSETVDARNAMRLGEMQPQDCYVQ